MLMLPGDTKMLSRKKINERAAALRREMTAIHYAYRHPELPLLPKMLIVLTLAYALSPIDLIPDFIPVLGHLDDLVILPALIALSIKLIPCEIMTQCRIRAEQEPVSLTKNPVAAAVIVLIWAALIAGIAIAARRLIGG